MNSPFAILFKKGYCSNIISCKTTDAVVFLAQIAAYQLVGQTLVLSFLFPFCLHPSITRVPRSVSELSVFWNIRQLFHDHRPPLPF